MSSSGMRPPSLPFPTSFRTHTGSSTQGSHGILAGPQNSYATSVTSGGLPPVAATPTPGAAPASGPPPGHSWGSTAGPGAGRSMSMPPAMRPWGNRSPWTGHGYPPAAQYPHTTGTHHGPAWGSWGPPPGAGPRPGGGVYPPGSSYPPPPRGHVVTTPRLPSYELGAAARVSSGGMPVDNGYAMVGTEAEPYIPDGSWDRSSGRGEGVSVPMGPWAPPPPMRRVTVKRKGSSGAGRKRGTKAGTTAGRGSRGGNPMKGQPAPHPNPGIKGVSWNKSAGKWQAYSRRLGPGKGRKHLGYFDTIGEAANSVRTSEAAAGLPPDPAPYHWSRPKATTVSRSTSTTSIGRKAVGGAKRAREDRVYTMPHPTSAPPPTRQPPPKRAAAPAPGSFAGLEGGKAAPVPAAAPPPNAYAYPMVAPAPHVPIGWGGLPSGVGMPPPAHSGPVDFEVTGHPNGTVAATFTQAVPPPVDDRYASVSWASSTGVRAAMEAAGQGGGYAPPEPGPMDMTTSATC